MGRHVLKPRRVAAVGKDQVNHWLASKQFNVRGITIVPADWEETWQKHLRKEYTELEAASLLSHLTAILQAFNNGDDFALILEDHVEISSAFLWNWEKYAKLAPSDWDVLQWATSNGAITNHAKNLLGEDPWMSWFPQHYGVGAYLIRRDGMEKLLNKTFSRGADGKLYWRIEEEELLVPDEVIYFLGGNSYTSTISGILSGGMDSVALTRHPESILVARN
jgi:GR25 family glycosyltransferase involved in LPS biosynthesis